MEAGLVVEEDLAVVAGEIVVGEVVGAVERDVAAEEELVGGRDAADVLDGALDGLDSRAAPALELHAVAVLRHVHHQLLPQRRALRAASRVE